MSKKKAKHGKGGTASHSGTPATRVSTVRKTPAEPTPRWMIPFLLVISFLVYLPILKAGFVNWDDMDYVYENGMIRDLSQIGLLLTTPVQGNYHPLTMLSLAINYAISGLDAGSYHLFNLAFHLINVYLVFRLARLLSRGNSTIAFVTSLLFALHPMHVESVAWISERKDVLYALFFIAGLISYTRWIDTGSKKMYGLTFVFLLLSLLSKPAAVIFPFVLFSIDLLRERRFQARLFLEKIPFLVPALVIGILTFLAQKEKGATDLHFTLATKIFLGFYGIMMYLFKMIFPFRLAAFYPFPATNIALPPEYYLGPIVFIGLVLLAWFSWKKTRVVAFGFLFYLLNLLLVLQFLPVGSAVIAERYTYVPYIGLFYIVGWLAASFVLRNKTAVYGVLFSVAVLLGILTYRQAGVWKDGASLWDHAIKTQPSANAYGLRASLLRADKKYDSAMVYYNRAVQLNPASFEVVANRGNLYYTLNKLDSAYADYRKALAIKPDYYPALDNLGALFATQLRYDSALAVLNKAIAIAPDYIPSYSNRALVHMNLKNYPQAIADYEKYLQYHPEAADLMNTLGFCYRMTGKRQEALNWINRAIEKQVSPYYFLNRSYLYMEMNNREMARADALRARQAGAQLDPAYLQQLGIQ